MFTSEQFTEYCIDQSRKVTNMINATVHYAIGTTGTGIVDERFSYDVEGECFEDIQNVAEQEAMSRLREYCEHASDVTDSSWDTEFAGYVDASTDNDVTRLARVDLGRLDSLSISSLYPYRDMSRQEFPQFARIPVAELPQAIFEFLESIAEECKTELYCEWYIELAS